MTYMGRRMMDMKMVSGHRMRPKTGTNPVAAGKVSNGGCRHLKK
jgi:hypothetical protein